jgi:catechol 2,3-dioxygenase-like lactoylglutathione lyase family enzyme
MIEKLTHTTVWVLDQDEALEFYTQKLGFQLHTDARLGDFRWLTVTPPKQPDHRGHPARAGSADNGRAERGARQGAGREGSPRRGGV